MTLLVLLAPTSGGSVTQTFAWDFAGSGAITDLSGNGRGFTLTGNTVRTAPGGGYTYGGTVPNSVGLTQTAADIQVGPSLTGLQTTARTVCGWAKIATSYTGHFMEYYRNPGDDTGVWTWLYLSGTFRARAKNAVGGLFERTVTPNTAYRFYAMTHDGANLKVYQDNGAGTLAQVGADVPMPSAVWTADVFRVFDQSGSNVTLSDWQGFDAALTLSELQALMTTPLAGGSSVTGTITGTLPAFTGSLTGTARVSGTASGNLPAMTGSLTGTVRVSGTGSGTLPALTGSFTATARASATITATLPGLTGSFTGRARVTGTATGTLPALTGVLTGNVTAPGTPVTGTLSGSLPALQGSVSGTVKAAGVLSGQLPAITSAATGVVRVSATLSGTLQAILGALTGTAGPVVGYVAPDSVTATPRNHSSTATPLARESTATARESDPSATARQYVSTATARSPE